VAGYCEHCNEHKNSIKMRILLLDEPLLVSQELLHGTATACRRQREVNNRIEDLNFSKSTC
jgi:hypothetical protein